MGYALACMHCMQWLCSCMHALYAVSMLLHACTVCSVYALACMHCVQCGAWATLEVTVKKCVVLYYISWHCHLFPVLQWWWLVHDDHLTACGSCSYRCTGISIPVPISGQADYALCLYFGYAGCTVATQTFTC